MKEIELNAEQLVQILDSIEQKEQFYFQSTLVSQSR